MLCNYNKLCKKKIFSNSICLCVNYILLLYINTIIKIQKIFRGYKTRKKINNIFIKLPTDIQKIIIHKINTPVYYVRYYNTINKIVDKRINNFLYSTNKKFDIEYINDCYYYVIKYHSIININEIKLFYIINNDIKCLIDTYIYYYLNDELHMNFLLNNDFIEILNLYESSFDKIILLENHSNTFTKIYKKYYNIDSNSSHI